MGFHTATIVSHLLRARYKFWEIKKFPDTSSFLHMGTEQFQDAKVSP